MDKVVNINQAKKHKEVKTSQKAKYIALTLNEIIEAEKDVIQDMQDIIFMQEMFNTAERECPKGDIPIDIAKYREQYKEEVENRLCLLDELLEVLDKYGIIKPTGTFEHKEIKEKYNELIDNDEN